MPFTFPEDMTMECYESYRPARAAPPDDPLGMAGQRPAGGHSHDEEDKIATFIGSHLGKQNALLQVPRRRSQFKDM